MKKTCSYPISGMFHPGLQAIVKKSSCSLGVGKPLPIYHNDTSISSIHKAIIVMTSNADLIDAKFCLLEIKVAISSIRTSARTTDMSSAMQKHLQIFLF